MGHIRCSRWTLGCALGCRLQGLGGGRVRHCSLHHAELPCRLGLASCELASLGHSVENSCFWVGKRVAACMPSGPKPNAVTCTSCLVCHANIARSQRQCASGLMHSVMLACGICTKQACGAGILKASGGDVDRALRRYNRERLPDIKALLALNQLWAARMGIRAEVGAWRPACTCPAYQLGPLDQPLAVLVSAVGKGSYKPATELLSAPCSICMAGARLPAVYVHAQSRLRLLHVISEVDRHQPWMTAQPMPAGTVTFSTNIVWGLQGQSFWEMVSFSSQKMLLNIGVAASFIPFKLAPSIFPRKLLTAAVLSLSAGSCAVLGCSKSSVSVRRCQI